MSESEQEPRIDVSRAARALLAMDTEMRRLVTPAFIQLLEQCIDEPAGRESRPGSGNRTGDRRP
jgi:hypothetical protein